MTAVSRDSAGRRVCRLACLSNRKRGTCSNGLSLPIERVERAVLGAIGHDLLRPVVIDAIVDSVCPALQPRELEAQAEALRLHLAEVDKEIANHTRAVGAGADLPSFITSLRDCQTAKDRLTKALASLQGRLSVVVDRDAIAAHFHVQASRWRALLTEHVEDGRQLLREILSEPLMFTPQADGTYHFEGQADAQKLVGSLGAPCVASPPGEGHDPLGFTAAFAGDIRHAA